MADNINIDITPITREISIEVASVGVKGDAGDAGQGVPIGGTTGQVLTKDSATDYDTSWQDAGGGATLEQEVTQVAHGFLVGDAIKHNGTIWTKAQADSVANAGTLGVVSVVTDLDNFTYTFGGILTVGVWTSGTDYFLSPSTAGDIITEPTYNVGEVREFLGTGTPDGLLLEIDLGDETAVSTAIPLTTKGDLLAYDTDLARLPVGTDDQVLTADSTASLGVAWKDAAGGGGYQTYKFNGWVDSVNTSNWVGLAVVNSISTEYAKDMNVVTSASMTTVSGATLNGSVPLGVANGNQTVDSFIIRVGGTLKADINQVSIVKATFSASNTIGSISVLYEGVISLTTSPWLESETIASGSFSNTSISNQDIIFLFIDSGSTSNIVFNCELRTTID